MFGSKALPIIVSEEFLVCMNQGIERRMIKHVELAEGKGYWYDSKLFLFQEGEPQTRPSDSMKSQISWEWNTDGLRATANKINNVINSPIGYADRVVEINSRKIESRMIRFFQLQFRYYDETGTLRIYLHNEPIEKQNLSITQSFSDIRRYYENFLVSLTGCDRSLARQCSKPITQMGD